MSEPGKISHADLARYWQCSPGNITNLAKRKGMPAFTSLREADEWRAVNAPPRKLRQTPSETPPVSSKIPTEVAGKNARVIGTTTPDTDGTTSGTPPDTDDPQLGLPGVPGGADRRGLGGDHVSDMLRNAKLRDVMPERIDVEGFIRRDRDFTEIMIEDAKEVPQIAQGLLKRAMSRGEPGAIAAATKNWHEAAGHAADVLERFMKIQQASGALLSIDDVAEVIMTELQEVRKNLKRLGVRFAAAANPTDPVLAAKVFDQAIDAALLPGEACVERVKLELAPARDEGVPSA